MHRGKEGRRDGGKEVLAAWSCFIGHVSGAGRSCIVVGHFLLILERDSTVFNFLSRTNEKPTILHHDHHHHCPSPVTVALTHSRHHHHHHDSLISVSHPLVNFLCHRHHYAVIYYEYVLLPPPSQNIVLLLLSRLINLPTFTATTIITNTTNSPSRTSTSIFFRNQNCHLG